MGYWSAAAGIAREDSGTDDAAVSARCLAYYRERFAEVGLYENKIYAGVPEMLAELCERRYRLFVASSKPTVYATRIVEHFSIDPYFDDLYGSEFDGTRSDKGALVAHLLEQAGLDSKRAVMVGDRRHDVAGAAKNGLACIAVTYGYGTVEELLDAGAIRLAANPRSIVDEVIAYFGQTLTSST